MDLIKKRERFGSRLGLAKIRILCQQIGNPQDSLRTIHIAGTNGKGSVAAYLRSVLQECGLRVGVYSSPHLVHYNERFTINEQSISDNDLRRLSEIVEEAATAVEETNPELGPVTEFEFATALGFLYFSTMDTDVVILETGLGGRLDATNIVLPKLTIITPIGHDHMDRLGSTISEIAAEKGGIIKSRIPVVVSEQKEEAAQVLAEIARHQQAPLFQLTKEFWSPIEWNIQGGALRFPQISPEPLRISLLGPHQLQNAATALLALQALQEQNWPITEQAIRLGLEKACWPGRLEVISPANPVLILDGAHNQEGLEALMTALDGLLGGEKVTFVFGMLENKALGLIDLLMPVADRFVFTQPHSSRIPPKDPQDMARYAQSRGYSAEGYGEAEEALDAIACSPRVCVCGSLYLLGEVKDLLDRKAKKGISDCRE